MVMQAIGSAFKKMSQRAMWRGDTGQAGMLQNHGMDGLRHNLLNDTPTYKKAAVGFGQQGVNIFAKNKTTSGANDTSVSGQNINNSNRNTNVNTKVKSTANIGSQNNAAAKKSVGASILGSLGL